MTQPFQRGMVKLWGDSFLSGEDKLRLWAQVRKVLGKGRTRKMEKQERQDRALEKFKNVVQKRGYTQL